MSILDALILGVIQGVTEFLPISSSGHLVLVEEYLGLNVAGMKSFDVVVHLGTLLAIFIYFWKDIWGMLKVCGSVFTGRLSVKDPYARLIGFILVGSVPAVIVGLTLEDYIDMTFRDTGVVAVMMIVVGLMFLLGERVYKGWKLSCKERVIEIEDKVMDIFKHGEHEPKEVRRMKWWKALIIGCAQALALVPGVSRSGSTIVAGLFQGIERKAAARFSFLLGIPVILGAGLIEAKDMGGFEMGLTPLLVGFIASFVFGLMSVYFLMNYLKKHSLIIFSVYLIAMGLIVLAG